MSECVLPGHGTDDNGQPNRREAEVGLLCLWHRNRMSSTNADIRDLWFDLSLIIEAGTAPKDETPKTRHLKSAEAPAPANLDALALRDPRSHPVHIAPSIANYGYGDPSNPIPPVLTIVASWLLCLAEERRLTETRHRLGLVIVKNRAGWTDIAYTAPMTLPTSVVAQLALLTKHHDWIAGQAWVDDYCAEMRDLHKALKAAVRDEEYRRVGRCHLPVDGAVCGGALLVENGSGVIRCSECRAAWVTAQQQALLAVTLEASS